MISSGWVWPSGEPTWGRLRRTGQEGFGIQDNSDSKCWQCVFLGKEAKKQVLEALKGLGNSSFCKTMKYWRLFTQ